MKPTKPRSFARASRLFSKLKSPVLTALLLVFPAFLSDARLFARLAEPESQNTADAATKEADSPWFRLEREGKTPVALQTSIVRFSGSHIGNDGQSRETSVDLVGAIHLAEREYYDALNEEFKNYETVVFELVAPKGSDVKELFAEREKKEGGKAGVSPLDFVSYSQIKLGEALGLIHQTDGINYFADNFVRGDMDSEDFLIQLFSNGDVREFLVDSFFEGFCDETLGQFEGWGVVLLCAQNRRLALRRLFAVELSKGELNDIDGETKRLENDEKDEEREGVLIHLRDKKAIAAVKKELDAGKTKIAVFFGAAHMPDLERKLEKEFGLKRDGEPRWLDAWKMKKE